MTRNEFVALREPAKDLIDFEAYDRLERATIQSEYRRRGTRGFT